VNTYKTSDGNRVTKAEIERRVRQAKKQVIENQLNQHGYNFCEECIKDGLPGSASEMEMRTLDCSHTVSVDAAQKMGKSELAWDISNILVLCRAHHKIKDKLNLKFKK
jgi:hypothetical protein